MCEFLHVLLCLQSCMFNSHCQRSVSLKSAKEANDECLCATCWLDVTSVKHLISQTPSYISGVPEAKYGAASDIMEKSTPLTFFIPMTPRSVGHLRQHKGNSTRFYGTDWIRVDLQLPHPTLLTCVVDDGCVSVFF